MKRLIFIFLLTIGLRAQPPDPTSVSSFNDGNQTFVTWTDPTSGTVANYRYFVYRSLVSNTGPWTLVQAWLLPNSGIRADFCNDPNAATCQPFTMTIRTGGTMPMATVNGSQLANGSGLAVITPTAVANTVWYGVAAYDITTTMFSATVAASGSVNEVAGTATPFLIAGSAVRGSGITLSNLPVYIALHGSQSTGAPVFATTGDLWGMYSDTTMGCEGGGQPTGFSAYQTGTLFGIPGNHIIVNPRDTIWYPFSNTPADLITQTWWLGDICTPIGTSATGPLFNVTTENRLISQINWLVTHYSADPNQIIPFGTSMGAMGATSLYRHHPELFAAIFTDSPNVRNNWVYSYYPTASNALGTISSTSPKMAVDGATSMQSEEDTVAFIQNYTGDNLPYYGLSVGENDGTLDPSYWSAAIALADALKAGHFTYEMCWNPGSHGNGPQASANTLFNDYAGKYRLNVTHPAFTNSSLDAHYSATKSASDCYSASISTTPVCCVNSGWSWSAIAETATTWQATISNANNSAGMTVDVTPRRAQSFHLHSGQTVTWTATGGQSGTATVAWNNVVTATGVTIPASSSVTVSFTLSTTSVPNQIRLNNTTGSTITNYPVQIGRPFVQGEIANYPQIGQCTDSTCASVSWLDTSHYQSDVKARWLDSSVKHAIISFVVASLPAGNTYFTFRNSVSANNTPIDQTAMLSGTYNFDATIQATFSGPTVVTASANTLLTAHSGAIPDCEILNWATATNTTACYWLKGPINTTVVIADHSSSRTGDFGADSNKSLRPIFEASFWPTLSATRTRITLENDNTETLQEQDYDVVLAIGTTPATVYTETGIAHYPAGRWTRGPYWSGVSPSNAVGIDHSLSYLSSTFAIPYYDTSKAPSGSAIASAYSTWTGSDTSIYGLGNWTYKNMGAAGGRMAIGPYPTWSILWMYTGDYRMALTTIGNAGQAPAFPTHFREGDTAKPNLGSPIYTLTRPTLLINDNNQFNYSYTTAADKIVPLTTWTNGTWSPELNHFYEPNYIPYLLIGEYYYFEEMWFWQSWGLFYPNPDPSVAYGRGPAPGTHSCIHAETRGDAWGIMRRGEFAWIAPDSFPQKNYYASSVNESLGCWEGERAVTGTILDASPTKTWESAFSGGSTIWLGHGIPTLHFWRYDSSLCMSPCNPANSLAAEAQWMESYLGYALWRLKEISYPSEPLLSWLAVQLTGMVNNPGDITPYAIGAYRIPAGPLAGGWYSTWADSSGGFDGFDLQAYFNGGSGTGILDPEGGYPYLAQTALSGMTAETGGTAAWAWLAPKTSNQSLLNDNPKWAILPRGSTPLSSGGSSTSGNITRSGNFTTE